MVISGFCFKPYSIRLSTLQKNISSSKAGEIFGTKKSNSAVHVSREILMDLLALKDLCFKKRYLCQDLCMKNQQPTFKTKIIASWCFFATHEKICQVKLHQISPESGSTMKQILKTTTPIVCVCSKKRFQVNVGINQMYPKYPNPSKLAIF